MLKKLLLLLLCTCCSVLLHAQSGTHLHFDGVNDYIDIPASPWNFMSSYTKEAWIKAARNDYGSILSSNSALFRLNNGYLEASNKLYGDQYSVPTRAFVGAITGWMHVAVVYDTYLSRMSIYINGNKMESSYLPASSQPDIFTGVQIGGLHGTDFFSGEIDEVRLWNKALTESEIRDRMYCGLRGSEPGLLAYFDFNQGIAGGNNDDVNVLENNVGGVTGQLVNFALTGATSNWVSGSPVAGNILPPLPPVLETQYLPQGGSVINLPSSLNGDYILWYADPQAQIPVGGSPLTPNIYYASASNNGCSSPRVPVEIKVTSIVVNNVNPVTCYGGSDGGATITVTDTRPGDELTYYWSTGHNTATISNMSAGQYGVQVNVNGIYAAYTNVEIPGPDPVAVSLTQLTDIRCFGDKGKIVVGATGGNGDYTYLWSNAATTNTIQNLPAGLYTVTVTDNKGCTAFAEYNIHNQTKLEATATSTDALCNGSATGTATVAATGGVGGYTYSWTSAGSAAATIANLTAGDYLVTVTDANACTAQATTRVGQPTALTISNGPVINLTCKGDSTGSATVTASGGKAPYTYSWFPYGGSAAIAEHLAEGSYDVTVSDANGCTATQTIAITAPRPITSVPVTTNLKCFGDTNGTAMITAFGGTGALSFSWYPAGGTGPMATGLAAGDYVVTITDARQCKVKQNISISSPAAITASASITDVSCFNQANGSAILNVGGGSGGYSYSWYPAGGTTSFASGLSARDYTVTITDIIGCTAKKNITISSPPQLEITSAIAKPITCTGATDGSLAVIAAGGVSPYTYSWTGTASNTAAAAGLGQGDYTANITDANGCTASHLFQLMAPAEAVCTAVSAPAPGTYTLGDVLTFTARYNDTIIVDGAPSLSLILNSGEVQANYVSGSGSKELTFTYVIKSGDKDNDGIRINKLKLNGGSMQNTHGCTASVALNNIASTNGLLIHIAIPQTITFPTLAAATYGDADFTLTATASSGMPVSYNSSNSNIATIVNGKIHVLHAGTVDITASQPGDVDYLAATAVTQRLTVKPLGITVTPILTSKTYGDADPAFDYSYIPLLISGDAFTGALSRAAGEAAGDYGITQGTLTVSNDYQLSFINARLTINKAVLTATAGNATICYGDPLPTVAITYSGFKSNDNVAVLTAAPHVSIPAYEVAGHYPITLSSGAADNYQLSYVAGDLNILAIPTGMITQNATSAGTTAGFILTAPAGTAYQWSTSEATPAITVRNPGNYQVQVRNAEGCVADFSLEVVMATISVPNTFSPNGDGINDFWTIPALKDFPSASVIIVNRDGQMVFETNHFTRWDGRRKGSGDLLPAGVYFYQIRTAPGNTPVTGWINLIR
ncbi:MBG domain-containing protein [Chitinophaga sp. sic0106]|uniref:MBG domain-containing protein n=1 Tax=Chitinophaga sp. sic0106 TaxID=2854785 RepID=UPI001C45BFCD|nr:MBG domain-containing protein [Chitinophaga sp. sic0106]MBV7529898.1 gliding motility-associated C-terminal domain-containing protein [Chitinophaga sp. sic0106]